ncbi:hypothetical protein D3C85_1432510 [compost metagenome]
MLDSSQHGADKGASHEQGQGHKGHHVGDKPSPQMSVVLLDQVVITQPKIQRLHHNKSDWSDEDQEPDSLAADLEEV